MANTLSSYDPLFYAQEGLIALEKALGLANRVYRDYDKDPREKGSVVDIRVPGEFTAANAPATAADITANNVQITLDQWKEVKFKLSDKELSYTQDVIIEEHIRPAAYALADNIDTALAALYVGIPWEEAAESTAAVSDIVNCRKMLFDNGVPMNDGMLHLMVSPTIEAEFLTQSAFAQWQGAGETGARTQIEGSLGRRYGFEIFGNQNCAAHTAGSLTIGTQLQLNANVSAGDTTAVFKDSGGSLTGTVKAGDSFVVAGNSQRYVITADATASSNLVSVSIDSGHPLVPGFAQDYSASDNVTITQSSHTQNLAFHRNWAALAMAPLPEHGNKLGAQVRTITDPITRLSLRSRMYYVGNSSEVHVALDVLYGVKQLDGNRAVRLTDA
jgi:hypothetical protein